ncbi:beta-lactamase/transpeptidase-like protein [Trametes polyzona]|nr:beta-lactamase/transpeptidase-like protein [Trametes polyzona]
MRLCSWGPAWSILVAYVAVTTASSQVPLQVLTPGGFSDEAILSPSFYSFVEELRKNKSIPGISVGAVRLAGDPGKEPRVHLLSWGRRTEDGDGNDLTPNTLFAIGSCSKAYLATSVGLLIDDFAHGRNVTPLPDGVTRLDWNTKIADILPEEWDLEDPWAARAANIRDVLGHVTGLPRHDFAYKQEDTPADVVRNLRHLRSPYELRETWLYNNQMYMLGSYIVAKYANTTYPAFVTERLFGPLNMSSSTFWHSEAQASGRLSQAWTSRGRRIPFWHTDDIAELIAGAGGIISSAEDTVKWLAAWLNKGVSPVSGESIIPEDTYETTTTAYSVVSGQPTSHEGVGIVGYGAGWQRWTYDGIEMISHTGGLPGFTSHTAFSPSSNLGIVILINSYSQDAATWTILKRAFDDVLKRTTSQYMGSQENARLPESGVTHPEPPSLNIAAYAGTYSAPGYGALTLYPSRPSQDLADTPSSYQANGTLPELRGAYPSVWSTHVRLRHRTHDTFELVFVAEFPHGYGRDTTAFEVYEPGFSDGRAEFVVEDGKVAGFSFVIDEEAVAARQRRLGGGLKETADAWFTKA